jgi:hypothetical protein
VAGFGEILWDVRVSEGQWQDRRASICASFMAMGGGKHMLPVKAEIHEAIKDVGHVVTVNLEERIELAKPRSKRSASS